MSDRRRDRSGEPFQDYFTENTGAVRTRIEDAQGMMRSDPDIDSQEADAMNKVFVKELRTRNAIK